MTFDVKLFKACIFIGRFTLLYEETFLDQFFDKTVQILEL